DAPGVRRAHRSVRSHAPHGRARLSAPAPDEVVSARTSSRSPAAAREARGEPGPMYFLAQHLIGTWARIAACAASGERGVGLASRRKDGAENAPAGAADRLARLIVRVRVHHER